MLSKDTIFNSRKDQIYEAGRGANKPHTYKIDIKTSDGYDSTAGTDDDVFIKIQVRF